MDHLATKFEMVAFVEQQIYNTIHPREYERDLLLMGFIWNSNNFADAKKMPTILSRVHIYVSGPTTLRCGIDS